MRSPLPLLALATILAASAFPACASDAAPEPEATRPDDGDKHEDGAVTGDEDELRQNLYMGGTLPRKTLVYTVDDGPNDGAGPSGSGDNTRRIAEYLASEGVPATFFVVGKQLTRSSSITSQVANPRPVTPQMDTLLKNIAAMPAGENGLTHLIASHTYSHGDPMTRLDSEMRQAEVVETHKLLAPYYTNDIHFLRTPYGSWSPTIYSQLRATSGSASIVGNIFWNVGGALDCDYNASARTWSCPRGAADWACWKPGDGRAAVPVEVCGQGYLNEIEGRAGRRGIILTHDIETKSLELAQWLIPRLKERGYTFVRLDQVPEINRDLIAAGATPAASVTPVNTPAPAPDPAAPPACREGTVLCGGVYSYGGEVGSLYRCVNGRLSIAYACADTCVKQKSPNPDSCTRVEGTGP